MENEKVKNNSGLIILLVLIILGLAGFIVYDKVLSNKEEKVKNNEQAENITDETKTEEGTKLTKWANYLIEQNITKITVHRTFKDYLDPEVGCPEDKFITKDELKQILEKMTQGKLTKFLDAGGFGGPCLPSIVVEYNDDKKLELFLNKYIITEDKNIKSLLELEDYIENNKRNSAMEELNTLFEYEWDDSFIETLFE